jgi:hypothetical protein
MSTRKAHSSTVHPPSEPRRNRLDLAPIRGLGTSSLTQHNRIDQPSAKMRLSGPSGGDKWGVFRCRAGGGLAVSVSCIHDALSGFCVLGGFTPPRSSRQWRDGTVNVAV